MDKKEKEKIVLENLPLIKKVASKIYYKLPDSCDVEFDDLVNVGVIGLLKAIENYDEKKAKLSTYAYIRIRGEILDYLRSLQIVPRTIKDYIPEEENQELEIPISNSAILLSIDRAISENEEDGSFADYLISYEKTPEEHFFIKYQKEYLEKILDTLNESEKTIIHMLYFEEKEPKEIAEKLGISLGRISQIKANALKKLKEILIKTEL